MGRVVISGVPPLESANLRLARASIIRGMELALELDARDVPLLEREEALMYDSMNLIWQIYTSHSNSSTAGNPGSKFGNHRGASMVASNFHWDWRSRFGATSASCSGYRRSSWAWGNQQVNLTIGERNWWARLMHEPSFQRVMERARIET